MAFKTSGDDTKWKYGRLHMIDDIPSGDPQIGGAIQTYVNNIDTNRQSRHWIRAIQWMENALFSVGRHYIDDVMVSRLTKDVNSNLHTVSEVTRNIPRPVNDILGRYVESNIALLTENRPRPRVTPKSEKADDKDAAELSELTLEYLWEALNMPQLHREIARILLHCGVCWMELAWDEAIPRRVIVPETTEEKSIIIPGPEGMPPLTLPMNRTVTKFGAGNRPVTREEVVYGDINARIVSPFEMHLPVSHTWNGDDMGWIIREYYTSKDQLIDRYTAPGLKLTKADGWHLDRLEKVGVQNVQSLPLWWWERMTDLVEGPGPTLFLGTPEQWDNYTVVRILDRKPCPKWPKGRTVIIAGDQVIYDSPKDKGARAYDPRWPNRWHPYVRFRWEGIMGSMYGRSLVSKLLPKLKRVNAIDTAMIMWRRTVPMAAWIVPKGAHPVEDIWSGKPGQIWEYDPRRTASAKPEPVFPQPFPEAALKEREQQIAEIESIAGTEEVLRGQRPTGVNSAAMIDILRKQALASRSAILQEWDESLQEEGTSLLQETIKHVKDDPRYAERIRILAREKVSRLTIETFSGEDLSDNVVCRVDTASQALVSKEARQAKVLEFLQYATNLMTLPMPLRQSIVDELQLPASLTPQGPDVDRAKRMITWIKNGQWDRVIPMPEDDPMVFLETLVAEMKAETFFDMPVDQQNLLIQMIEKYKIQLQMKIMQQMQMQAMMGGGPQGGAPPAGGAPGGGA